MIRELILQFKLGRVSQSYFRTKFNVEVAERFHQQIDDMKRRGLASVEGDWIMLTRAALLKVDTLLHAFFLPQHQSSRYT